MKCAMCGVKCAVCCVQCAVCYVLCAMCSVQQGVSTCVSGWEAAWGPFPRGQVNPPFVIIIINVILILMRIIVAIMKIICDPDLDLKKNQIIGLKTKILVSRIQGIDVNFEIRYFYPV